MATTTFDMPGLAIGLEHDETTELVDGHAGTGVLRSQHDDDISWAIDPGVGAPDDRKFVSGRHRWPGRRGAFTILTPDDYQPRHAQWLQPTVNSPLNGEWH